MLLEHARAVRQTTLEEDKVVDLRELNFGIDYADYLIMRSEDVQ